MAHLAALFAKRGPPPAGVVGGVAKPSKQDVLPSDGSTDITTSKALQDCINCGGCDRLVIVAFVISFSPPCDMVMKELKDLQQQCGNIDLVRVPVDLAPSLADSHAIEATPTLLFFIESKQVHALTTAKLEVLSSVVAKWSKRAAPGQSISKPHHTV